MRSASAGARGDHTVTSTAVRLGTSPSAPEAKMPAPPLIAVLAAVLAVSLLVASISGCSSGGGSDGSGNGAGETDRTPEATVGDEDGSGGAFRPPDDDLPPPIEPHLVDVPDQVFPGRGDPRIDVLHYDIEVRAGADGPTVQGRSRIELRALTEDPLPSFTLDLRGPEIRSVTVDGDGATVTAGDPDGQVTIEPAKPLPRGQVVEVAITWAGEPAAEDFPAFGIPIGWQPDGHDGWFTLGQPDGTSTWTPVNDHPSDKATWQIAIDTPAGVTGVSNGTLVSSDGHEGRTRWVWQIDEPMAPHLLLAAVGDYRLVDRSGPDGLPITLAVHGSVAEQRLGGFDRIDEIIEFFSETFGEYPASSGGAIVIPVEIGLALETQTRPTFGTDGMDHDHVWALAHELAHEWFGNAVTPARWDDLWLSESFATYADWLWLDHTGVEDIDDLAAAAQRATGRHAVLDPEAAASFSNTIYVGGARALHGLRAEVGDDVFFDIVRTWYAEHRGGTATTGDFVELAERVSGDDLGEWVKAWLESPEQPDLPG